MDEVIDRVNFVCARDGVLEGVCWAHQTKQIYRKAILRSRSNYGRGFSHASLREYRPAFLRSYASLKSWLEKR